MVVIFYLLIIGFLIISLFLLLQGAIYVPSKILIINKMIKLSKFKKGDRMVDLGSGDGRVVIEFAKKGIEAFGYEINPVLVLISRYKIKRSGLDSKAKIYFKSFWGEDLSKYSIITIFGIDYIMKRLERKLKRELKSGSRVLSNLFGFPSWKEEYKNNGISLYKV